MGLVVERNDSASCTRMDSRRSKCCRSDTMNAVLPSHNQLHNMTVYDLRDYEDTAKDRAGAYRCVASPSPTPADC